MICSKCGAQIADDSAICPVCGNMVNSNSSGMGVNGSDAVNSSGDGFGNPGGNSDRNGYGGSGNYDYGSGSNGYGSSNGYTGGGNYQRETQPQFVRQPRSIALAIIFTIITCGIYGIYWFIVLTDEVNEAAGEIQGTSGGVAFLLTIVTCGIYGIYWAYKQGEKLDRAKSMRGVPSSNSGVLYLILELIGFGIIAWALMQNELNNMY